MGVADFGAQSWAGIMVGVGALPANFYVALCTDEPGDGWDGSVVATVEPEAADSTYARQPIAIGSGWTISDQGFAINAVQLHWPTPVADWGLITHYAILDDATVGNLWFYEAFAEALYIPAGFDVSLGIGSLSLGVADQLVSIAE